MMIAITMAVPLAAAYASYSQVTQDNQVSVKSKTALGVEFPGLVVTADNTPRVTPFPLTLGTHALSARSIPRVNGTFYHFVKWEDASGAIISNRISFTYDSQTTGAIYAVYANSTSPSEDSGYTIFIDPVYTDKIEAKNDLTGKIDYVGTDPAAVLQSAIDALAGSGGTILLTSGTYVWQSVPALPRNLPDWLKIVGQGSTTIQLTASGPRAFDFGKTADYDTFRKIAIENLTIDCNNVGGQHHVVLGTYINGREVKRINVEDIILRGITTTNVPVDPTTTNHRLNIQITPYDDRPGGPQIHVTNILVEDCDFHGGNEGIGIGGTGPNIVGLPIFLDNINIINCRHSMLSPPTMLFASANFQVGGRGFGGYAHIANCYGEYSGDAGVEINAIDALVENTTIRDAKGAFLFDNYNNPQSGKAQQVVFRNCVALKIDLPSTLAGHGWRAVSRLSVELGALVIDHCTFYSTLPSFYAGEAVNVVASSGMTGLTISNFNSTIEQIDYSAAEARRINPILIGVTGGRLDATLNNIELVVTGKRQPNAGTLLATGIDVKGDAVLDFRDIAVDINIINMPAYSIAGINLGGMIGNVSSTLYGTIRRYTVQHAADDPKPAGIVISGKETLTIDGQLLIEDCNFSSIAGADPIRFAGNSNMEQVVLSNNTYG